MQTDTARFASASMLSWNDVGEELTLFDGASQRYFALNGPAATIWRELVAGHSIRETIDALAMRFGEARGPIAADVHAFVGAALGRQLLIAQP